MTAVALPTWRMPDDHEVALLLAVGALGFLAHLALIHAFTIAPSSLLATFDYPGSEVDDHAGGRGR
jgi:hypothetical protein